MSQPYLSHKSHILKLIDDQINHVKEKKALKLTNIISTFPGTLLSEIIECVHEYLYSFQPPIELEKLSLQNNELEQLPSNIRIIASKLRYLNLHNNRFSKVPEVLTEMPNLEVLDLSRNNLYFIPPTVARKLSKLTVLCIKENKFKYLSTSFLEMTKLSILDVSENPLVLPTQEKIRSFKEKATDNNWLNNLKNYLIVNLLLIESKISEQYGGISDDISDGRSNIVPRSKSISEVRTKASRAAKRMGLIINKPEDSFKYDKSDIQDAESSGTESPISVAPSSKYQNSGAASAHNLTQHPPKLSSSLAIPIEAPSSLLGKSNFRNRFNTLREINNILEKNDSLTTEHKSVAYFRRLSTLEELPVDDIYDNRGDYHDSNFANEKNDASQRVNKNRSQSVSDERAADDEATEYRLPIKSGKQSAGSGSYSVPKREPIKEGRLLETNTFRKIDNHSLMTASRKLLFLFSEVHSSVRRFSTFFVDKKVTLRIVISLHSTKSTIDSLVETLELTEENGENINQIYSCLNLCISSFRSIMSLLGEYFSVAAIKIDSCFIRMLYLTLYGAFHELYNSYRILAKAPQRNLNLRQNLPFKMSNVNNSTSLDPKQPGAKQQHLTVNTDINNDLNEIDEKLYTALEITTSNAQVVFSELNKAISKSAVASATGNPPSLPSISPSVASKVKELTSICVLSMDITKRLKQKLNIVRQDTSLSVKKAFWDDINSFLKSIIQTFSAVKSVMKDMPILNEIRSSMATLSKDTKDVTILLEVSSYRSMPSEISQSQAGLPQNNSGYFLLTPASAYPVLQGNQLMSPQAASTSTQPQALTTPKNIPVGTTGNASRTPNYNETPAPVQDTIHSGTSLLETGGTSFLSQ